MVSERRTTQDLVAEWERKLRAYSEAFAPLGEWDMRPPANDSAVVNDLRDALLEMFVVMVAGEKAYRDNWFKQPGVRNWVYGHGVACVSKKLQTAFEFGVDIQGFLMSTELLYPQHLRRMTNAFWDKFLKLGEIGNLTYRPNVSVSTAHGEDADKLKSKSEMFRVIRDAVLLESDHSTEIGDMGGLDVRWFGSTPVGEVVVRGGDALRILWELNYELYRAEYQLRHGRRTSSLVANDTNT